MTILNQNNILKSKIHYQFKKPTSGFLEFIPLLDSDKYQKIGNFTFPSHISINLNQILILDNCIIIQLPNNLSFCTNTLTKKQTQSFLEKCVS